MVGYKNPGKYVVIIITVARVTSSGDRRRDPGPESQGLEISRLESESAAEVDAGTGWEKFTETNHAQ